MSSYLITGGNRGIGLELSRQLAARDNEVIVACRRRSPELDALGVEVVDGKAAWVRGHNVGDEYLGRDPS